MNFRIPSIVSVLLVTSTALFALTQSPFTGEPVPGRSARNPSSGWTTRGPVDPGAADLPMVQVPPGFEHVVVFSTNSTFVKSGGHVSGDVVVNNVRSAPTVDPNTDVEIRIGRGATVDGDVRANGIQLDRGATISGTASCNFGDGITCTGLPLPVFASLPAFQQAAIRPDAEDVFVPAGTTQTLPQGDFGHIQVAGTLVFSGGIYNVRSISSAGSGGNCAYPCLSIEFSAPTDLRIEERFDSGKNAYVGPQAGSGISAADVILYVGGTNGGSGTATDLPPAATCGQGSTVLANIYAPYGTVLLDKDSTAEGAFLGRDVRVDTELQITLESHFKNGPPTADPQTLYTSGVVPQLITLTGSDPEEESLSFSISTGPTQGMLTDLTEIVPPAVNACSVSGGPCTTTADCPLASDSCETAQPPVSSATVLYTPDSADLEDNFTFRVTDPHGAYGEAVVLINPPGDPTVVPPVTEVTADDISVGTFEDTPVTLHLTGGAPPGVSLTFAILTGPASGDLGPVSQNPPTNATVTYTPGAGFVGTDSFTFQACGDAIPQECATATATLTVEAPSVVADSQTIITAAETPVSITLSASAFGVQGAGVAGGIGSRLIRLVPRRVTIKKAAWLDDAEIAGSVLDVDGDGLGDARDSLPGPAPELVSAAVDAPLTGFFDFEVESGFPEGSPFSAEVIGSYEGIYFDARTYGSLSYSGSQSMTGNGVGNDTATFTSAFVDFTALPVKPHSFSLWGLDLTAGETIEVTVTFSDGSNQIVDVELGGQPAFTPIPVNFSDPTKSIESLSIRGTELENRNASRAWAIDDLSIGGAASEGAPRRVQIEWDIAELEGLKDALVSAEVILQTNKGSVDSLDTSFYVGTEDQDGLLTVSDFEAPAELLPGVVMPVPNVPPGTSGTFSFDVKSQLLNVLYRDDISHFSIQARVDESLAGSGFQRGLQIYSTADGNLQTKAPALSLTTPGVIAPPTFTIVSLPLYGTVYTGGTPVTQAGIPLPSCYLTYIPDPQFIGVDSFEYQATVGDLVSSPAVIQIIVESSFGSGDCTVDGDFCNKGRNP